MAEKKPYIVRHHGPFDQAASVYDRATDKRVGVVLREFDPVWAAYLERGGEEPISRHRYRKDAIEAVWASRPAARSGERQ